MLLASAVCAHSYAQCLRLSQSPTYGVDLHNTAYTTSHAYTLTYHAGYVQLLFPLSHLCYPTQKWMQDDYLIRLGSSAKTSAPKCWKLAENQSAEIKWQWNVTPLIGDFEGRVGIHRFLYSPPSPWVLPSLFICRDFFLFCHFNRVHARLQTRGLAMSACH